VLLLVGGTSTAARTCDGACLFRLEVTLGLVRYNCMFGLSLRSGKLSIKK